MWSQTKKKLENFTCDSLKDRVKFFSSNYRMHDGIGRTYIAVDGAEVYNMCTLKRDYYRHPKPGCYSQVEKPIEASFMQKKGPESQHSCGLPGFIGARDGT